MTVWFEGASPIACHLDDVKRAFSDPGQLYTGLVRLMPGLSSVVLLAQQPGSVWIQTSEGRMDRTNIKVTRQPDSLVVELDEVYQAGKRVTVTTHYRDVFTIQDGQVLHHTTLSDVSAPGMLGYLYRTFGSANTGQAVLDATRTYFERSAG